MTPQAEYNALMASCGYNPAAKKEFHRVAAKYLKRLQRQLDGMYGDGGLRHNQGGIAVSGDITLHLERLYVQVSEPFAQWGEKKVVMFRECKGLKDYTGGQNNFADAATFMDTARFARIIQTRCSFPMKMGDRL